MSGVSCETNNRPAKQFVSRRESSKLPYPNLAGWVGYLGSVRNTKNRYRYLWQFELVE